MTRIFRIDFYPHEWLTLTSHMTPEQKGVFIDIIAMIYAKRGAIKNDAAHFGRVSNCSSRLARSIVDSLIQQGDLLLVGDGFVTNKRCEDELNKKRTHLEDSSKGGRIKAEKLRQLKENNELDSSEQQNPLRSSYPTPPQPHKNKNEDESSFSGDSLFPDLEVAKPKSEPQSRFDELWQRWQPFEMSKGSKQSALKAYTNALKRTDHETIIRSATEYCSSCANVRCKTKHVASWLNARGWEEKYENNVGNAGQHQAGTYPQGGRTQSPERSFTAEAARIKAEILSRAAQRESVAIETVAPLRIGSQHGGGDMAYGSPRPVLLDSEGIRETDGRFADDGDGVPSNLGRIPVG